MPEETTKRTPGEWTAGCTRDDIEEANVILAGDVIIARVIDSDKIRERHNKGKIEGPGSTAGTDSLDEVDANAILIAAAPNLLAACNRLLDAASRGCPSPEKMLDEAMELARAAVARAEGRAS